MKQIETAVLNRDVQGLNLHQGTFADQLNTGRTLLVFLRHFG